MPRQARIDAPGALHHIICRGMERKAIFRDDWDRNNFLERLGTLLPATATPCLAWALMPNHVHLLLRTGCTPISDIMRRLLTGYAVTFNHRHARHGKLFQNRYKSILCEEEPYLLELVRYIHLNPLRAGLVADLDSLDRYPYAGHAVVIGNLRKEWQDTGSVLVRFGDADSRARQRYREFLRDGLAMGRRPELTGGGMIRSLGGWKAAKESPGGPERVKSDERILGGSDFVDAVLRRSEEELDRRARLKAAGYGLDELAREVAGLFDIEPSRLLGAGRSLSVVRARSLFCYRAVRELGESGTALARKLRLSQPAVSIAVRRGEAIAKSEIYRGDIKRNL